MGTGVDGADNMKCRDGRVFSGWMMLCIPIMIWTLRLGDVSLVALTASQGDMGCSFSCGCQGAEVAILRLG